MNTEILIVIMAIMVVGFVVYLIARKPPTRPSGKPVAPDVKKLDLHQTFFPRLPTIQIAYTGGPQSGQSVIFKGEQIHIGRNPDCQICVPDGLVSWNHAMLAFSNGQYVLYDQDSTNGTWVNGQRIAQCVIRPNQDQIQVGPVIFVLQSSDYPQVPLAQSAQPASSAPAAPALPPAVETPKEQEAYSLDDYQRLEELGQGGAATVYKAISKRDQQTVALKILQNSDDPYLRDKFKKEGSDIAQLLVHPHIVRVYGGGESRGALYLVMELMHGGTLRDRMSTGGLLPFEQTVTIIGQVCDALQYAHARGVFHRDIKPENIFLTQDGQAKLGDFGIARLAQSVTRTASGWLIGTPSYMSFEQAKGHDIDGRSDLYALGIVLYEMVTGRCPFEAKDPLQIVDMHIQARPMPPSKLNPAVPRALEHVILRVLEKDRQRRFATAEEMARALGYTAPMQTAAMAPSYSAQPAVQTMPPALTSRTAANLASLSLLCSNGARIPLTTEVILLNRATLSINDPEISRNHARVIRRDTYHWIEDTGSANGTFVNGMRVFAPQLLQPGDEIRLGRTLLRVVK